MFYHIHGLKLKWEVTYLQHIINLVSRTATVYSYHNYYASLIGNYY